MLLRRLACTAGEMDVEVAYAPRPEYGLTHPILEAILGGAAARGGACLLPLSAPVTFGMAILAEVSTVTPPGSCGCPAAAPLVQRWPPAPGRPR